MKKKIIIFAIIIYFFHIFNLNSIEYKNNLFIGNLNLSKNILKLPITIKNFNNNIVGFQLKIKYNFSKINFSKCIIGDIIENEWVINCKNNNKGNIIILGFSPLLNPLSSSDGNLIELEFIAKMSKITKSDIKIISAIFSDKRGEKILLNKK